MTVDLLAFAPDTLAGDAFEDAPFGAILVDADGTILRYNRTEARFARRDPQRTVGRNFFTDVAPCTNLPAFHGRFLDGVRSGALDIMFGFVFGFDPPARVRVRMCDAATPGAYWILVEQCGTLAPSRHRTAATAASEAVDRRARAEPIDPTVCEREPIHVPGAIQPHAAMLAFDADTLVVLAASDNIADATGMTTADALGRPLDAIVPPVIARRLAAALCDGALDRPARPWRAMARLGSERRMFALTAHRNGARVILEVEMTPDHPEDFGGATPLQAHDAVVRLRGTDTLVDAATACAHEVRAMTGFERVLVYRFDVDWNGEAIGESRATGASGGEDDDDAGYPSLLGLRFPASDIPAQARALYLKAPARFVVDRDAVPAAVLAQPAAGNHAIDLTYAYSRALSPIHLEYQRNLGVNGSMSISILVDGALWGLVIGHHRRPHYVTPDTRALAALVTDAFALRVQELTSRAAWAEQQAALQVQAALLRRLAGADDFVAALTRGDGATILSLLPATGAAVVSDDRVTTLGTTPQTTSIAAIATWLRAELPSERRTLATADLPDRWPDAAAFADTGSGLLATFVDADRQHLLLWFRPEQTSTVAWGGNPNKPVLTDTATDTILPRRSFERWVEERRGHALDWADWHVAAAQGLAAAIEDVVLRQGRRIAELSAKEADLTAALAQKDVLAREIDHRVKNSLQIVAGVLLMQARAVDDADAKAAFRDTYARVMSVARVHDSLQQADDAETVDLGRTLRLLCDDLGSGIADDRVVLSVDAQPGLMVPSRTAVALSLIATELVTNALKYAYPTGAQGPVELSVHERPGGDGKGGYTLRVCDYGRGLSDDWATRKRSDGGLGMRVVRAMLDQIGGEMTVIPDRAPGACFTVSV